MLAFSFLRLEVSDLPDHFGSTEVYYIYAMSGT